MDQEQPAKTSKLAEWINARLSHIRALKQPSDQQRLLLILADLPSRTAEQDRQFAALIRAERAADRYTRARASAARIVDAEKRAARIVAPAGTCTDASPG